MSEEVEIILSRYFSGEATEKELRALEIWLSKSGENEKNFHQISLLYQYVGQTNTLPAVDIEKALLKFKNYIKFSCHSALDAESPYFQEIAGQARNDEHRKNNRISFFNPSTMWKAAAAVALLLIVSFSVFYFINKPSETIQLMATETSKEYKLFENTNVTLFSGAEIAYNAKAKQAVKLTGKARFNTSERIVVQAGETFIENFGTIFTVDATNSNNFITVEVSEGEVRFYTNTNAGVHLKSNEMATYNVHTKQFSTIVETLHTTSLPQELIFQNTPLQDAIDSLKKHYGVEITISTNGLNDVLLNASFDKNEPLETVLDIITATISTKWTKKGEGYVVG